LTPSEHQHSALVATRQPPAVDERYPDLIISRGHDKAASDCPPQSPTMPPPDTRLLPQVPSPSLVGYLVAIVIIGNGIGEDSPMMNTSCSEPPLMSNLDTHPLSPLRGASLSLWLTPLQILNDSLDRRRRQPPDTHLLSQLPSPSLLGYLVTLCHRWQAL
jgi:hypothetical protein